MTQKSERKAAAADANDRTIFKRTQFGRLRVPSYPVRLIVGIIALPVILFIFVYSSIRSAKRPG